MSELINTRHADFRGQLLATASALALLAFVQGAQTANAADEGSDKPIAWIELGGQFEQQTGQGEAFIPDFVLQNASLPGFKDFNFQSQKGNSFSNGFNGQLTFQPTDSDWVFSASALYGRSNSGKVASHITPGHPLHHKTLFATYTQTPGGYSHEHFRCCKSTNVIYTTGFHRAYANMQSEAARSHAIVDFSIGRDVGLGLFGGHGSSVLNAGVRFAQFVSKSNVIIHGRPDREFMKHYVHYAGYTYSNYRALPTHRYSVTENSARDFHGVGPAISWNAASPLLGNAQTGEIELDWGANVAVLFGRQQANGNHQTSSVYVAHYSNTLSSKSGGFSRKRTVTVPNLGGFAGLSFRYANAKVSFGYRGDFFFGAMDAGNDTKKTETVGFYGPFATISIGLGG